MSISVWLLLPPSTTLSPVSLVETTSVFTVVSGVGVGSTKGIGEAILSTSTSEVGVGVMVGSGVTVGVSVGSTGTSVGASVGVTVSVGTVVGLTVGVTSAS